jgi:hypothetical protein
MIAGSRPGNAGFWENAPLARGGLTAAAPMVLNNLQGKQTAKIRLGGYFVPRSVFCLFFKGFLKIAKQLNDQIRATSR